MKKVVMALALALVLGALLLVGLDEHGFGLGPFRVDWDSQGAAVKELAESFLEDLQYKDFDSAASYHTHADRQSADIPRLIERTFKVKPELLNLRDVRVTGVDFDSGRRRARTFFTATVELLNSAKDQSKDANRERRAEGVLYWHLRPTAEGVAAPEDGGPDPPPGGESWFLMLESSLR